MRIWERLRLHHKRRAGGKEGLGARRRSMGRVTRAYSPCKDDFILFWGSRRALELLDGLGISIK